MESIIGIEGITSDAHMTAVAKALLQFLSNEAAMVLSIWSVPYDIIPTKCSLLFRLLRVVDFRKRAGLASHSKAA